MVKVRSKVVKIDESLAVQISNFAKKNDISFRQASKEIANLNNLKLSDKKIMKEIRF